jgi:RNA polymerase sigma factor (sigma-70 family)
MTDSLFNDAAGSTPNGKNASEPEEVLNERDINWPEGYSTTESIYNFYRRLVNRFHRKLNNSYIAEICADKVIENLVRNPPLQKQLDAYLNGKSGQVNRRLVDGSRDPRYRQDRLTQSLFEKNEENESQNEEGIPEKLAQPVVEDTALLNEELMELSQAFASCLTELERACMILRFVDDRSAEEVAEILHIKSNYVDTLVRRARIKLKAARESF